MRMGKQTPMRMKGSRARHGKRVWPQSPEHARAAIATLQQRSALWHASISRLVAHSTRDDHQQVEWQSRSIEGRPEVALEGIDPPCQLLCGSTARQARSRRSPAP
jgi:hypothetical protein